MCIRDRVNTVRSSLARFGIPEHDEYYILWNKVLVTLTPAIRKLEDGDFPAAGLSAVSYTHLLVVATSSARKTVS